ncbi:hypothetical protein ILYODFUR_034199, partial [Ilyodon furcidens]
QDEATRIALRCDSLGLSCKAVVMTPMVHLLLLPSLLCIAAGMDLEEMKGPFEDTALNVEEATRVPYPVHK